MRKFNSLVISETEPLTEDTIWLRDKKNILQPDDNVIPYKGLNLWYFGENGWESMYDSNTEYKLNLYFNYNPAYTNPVTNLVNTSSDKSNVTITSTYFIYTGSRELSNTINLVTEKALKKHIEELQEEIDTLGRTLNTLNNRISTLEGQNNSYSTTIANLEQRISALETTS